jgi:hypothetical protein
VLAPVAGVVELVGGGQSREDGSGRLRRDFLAGAGSSNCSWAREAFIGALERVARGIEKRVWRYLE